MFRTIICEPLGFIMRYLYQLTGNYGVAIILFTIAVKLILLPFGIKQQKSMVETQKLQPKLQELQKKYKNDKEKLSQETMKLYQEHNVSPMGGCLPLLIQMPILFGLIRVIYQPLTYMLSVSADKLAELEKLVGNIPQNMAAQKEIFIASQSVIPAEFRINFNFFGIDLAGMPVLNHISVLWILPILAVLATFATSYISQKMSSANAQNDEMNKSMGMMMWMMPLMTLFFVFKMPVGASLYWFMSSATSTIQQVVLNKIFMDKPQSDVIVVDNKKKKGGK